MFDIRRNQAQRVTFVMIDVSGDEVSGLGATFTVEISKNGGAFAASAGAKAEIGSGWYSYDLTAAETDTLGPLSIRVTGAGALQQNLLFFVETVAVGAIEFTYTVTSITSGLPIEGVIVWITTDLGGVNTIWSGDTDAFGVARDDLGRKPYLTPGTYYFWRYRLGFSFTDPDTEVVS